MGNLCEDINFMLNGGPAVPEDAVLLEDICWDSRGIVHALEELPEGINEVRVIRGGKITDISGGDLRKEKIARQKRKKKPHKRRGPMSSATKQAIARGRKKSAKTAKASGL